jgi:EAL domain-containing protein (putative c-di-GMP-specific phosphodiesterase class I)
MRSMQVADCRHPQCFGEDDHTNEQGGPVDMHAILTGIGSMEQGKPFSATESPLVDFDAVCQRVRAAVEPARAHAVSLHDEHGDVLWLSESSMGPDEHNAVREAFESFSSGSGPPVLAYDLGDARSAVLLRAVSARRVMVGAIMVIMDTRVIKPDERGGIKIMTPKLQRAIMDFAGMRPDLEPPPAAAAAAHSAIAVTAPARNVTPAPVARPAPSAAAAPLEPFEPFERPARPARLAPPAPPAPAISSANTRAAPSGALQGRPASGRATPTGSVAEGAPRGQPAPTRPASPASSAVAPPRSAAPQAPAESGESSFELTLEDSGRMPPVRAQAPRPAPPSATSAGRSQAPFELALEDSGRMPPVPAQRPQPAAPPETPAERSQAPFELTLEDSGRIPAGPALRPQPVASAPAVAAPAMASAARISTAVPVPAHAPLPAPAGNGHWAAAAPERRAPGTEPPIDRLLADLRRSPIALHVQHLVPLTKGSQLKRYEVLLRSRSEDAPNAAPTAMLQSAVDNSLGSMIDRRVLTELVGWLVHHPDVWQSNGVMFSVNLTTTALHDEHFIKFVGLCLAKSSLPKAMIAFEVDVATAVQLPTRVAEVAAALHRLGCPMVLDDFALRTECFTLLRLPGVRYVKLAPEITAHMRTDKHSQASITAVVQMARVLGMHTVAKHTGTPAEQEWLTALGVDFVQSHALSPPAAIDSLSRGQKTALT